MHLLHHTSYLCKCILLLLLEHVPMISSQQGGAGKPWLVFPDPNTTEIDHDREFVASDRGGRSSKFEQIQKMIMYLQDIPEFGKYSYYGCFCFPAAQNGLFSGRGRPVDEIDNSCKQYHQCNRCIGMDYGKAVCEETNSYSYQALDDDGSKSIVCIDAPGSCNHARCSCDKKLADDLALHQHRWNVSHHAKYGHFDSSIECNHHDKTPQVEPEIGRSKEQQAAHHAALSTLFTNNELGGDFQNSGDDMNLDIIIADDGDSEHMHREEKRASVDECCGKYPNRFPFFSNNGLRKCCGSKIFDYEYLRCCDEESSRIVGNDEQC